MVVALLKSNADFIAQPLTRSFDEDEEFLEQVNISLNEDYIVEIEEESDLKLQADNFHDYQTGYVSAKSQH